jgi:ribosomal protein S27E
VFNPRHLKAKPGTVIAQDQFRTVEVATNFKRIHCYHCDLAAIYKYRVKQVRRSPTPPEGESVPEHDLTVWKTIPRFAEIPETVKCKGCGEVLGVYPECIF